jgi:ribosomal-protein-alanine N-acetyltransferase
MRLTRGDVTLRPVRRLDAGPWVAIRLRNQDWLEPWEALPPEMSGTWAERQTRSAWAETVRVTRAQARRGEALPFAIEYTGRLAGQLTLAGLVRGPARTASIGYWVDSQVAGRGVGSTAVSLAVAHAFGPVGLHRLEALVRPENIASRRLLECLGFRIEGTAQRALHVDGDWRDHLIFAITASEWE